MSARSPVSIEIQSLLHITFTQKGKPMRLAMATLLLIGVATGDASAQTARTKGARPKSSSVTLTTQMMKFDKNKDGKLTKSEVTDARLSRLFDRADADEDGTVTKEELAALETKEAPAPNQGGPGFGGPGGPGFGGSGGPPGGFGRRGPGGPNRPGALTGEILPPEIHEQLELTATQEKDLAALQKDVDTRLAKILTAEQKKQVESMMRRRGPGGPGFGGPGGPPPEGGRGRRPPMPPGEPD